MRSLREAIEKSTVQTEIVRVKVSSIEDALGDVAVIAAEYDHTAENPTTRGMWVEDVWGTDEAANEFRLQLEEV